MAEVKEKFDGLRQRSSGGVREYLYTYTVNGVAAIADFPA